MKLFPLPEVFMSWRQHTIDVVHGLNFREDNAVLVGSSSIAMFSHSDLAVHESGRTHDTDLVVDPHTFYALVAKDLPEWQLVTTNTVTDPIGTKLIHRTQNVEVMMAWHLGNGLLVDFDYLHRHSLLLSCGIRVLTLTEVEKQKKRFFKRPHDIADVRRLETLRLALP